MVVDPVLLSASQAIIYVVDSSDTERIGTSAEEFHAILDEEELRDALILVYANKQACTHPELSPLAPAQAGSAHDHFIQCNKYLALHHGQMPCQSLDSYTGQDGRDCSRMPLYRQSG